MHILVTGGAGFIGCHVCERLIDRGHTLVVADDLSLGRRELIAHLEGNDLRFVEMDVTAQARLDQLFCDERFDAVFHLAANSDIGRSFAEPATDYVATLGTTYAVLEAMRKHAVNQIVFASTSAIYGEAPGQLGEDFGPLKPISHYGAAKLASEAFLSSYGENYGIRSWIVRFPNVVGDRSTHGAIYDFVRKLRATPDRLEVLGDGNQEKPYLHVDDLVEAILTAWDVMEGPFNVVNVAGTTRATVRRMAEIVVEESGLDARIEYMGGDRGWKGDVPKVAYDTSLIQSLGWTPKLDSEGAVRAAARWILDATA